MSHGNQGNNHAAKPDEEKASSFLHIRVRRQDKAKWVKQSQTENKKLSEWVIEKLNG